MQVTILPQPNGFTFLWESPPELTVPGGPPSATTWRPPLQAAVDVVLDAGLAAEVRQRVDLAVAVLDQLGSPGDREARLSGVPAGVGGAGDTGGSSGGGSVVGGAGGAADPLESLGTVLFNQILPPGLRAALRALPPGSPLTLVTRDTAMPWELLHDGTGFLALRHPIGRRLLAERPAQATAAGAGDRPRALVVANPGGDLPAAEAEAEALLDVFDAATGTIRADLICRDQASRARVLEALADGGYGIVHFAGHARPGALQLTDGWLAAEAIRDGLRGAPLVFLNACASGREIVPGIEKNAAKSGDAPGLRPAAGTRDALGLGPPAASGHPLESGSTWGAAVQGLAGACLLGGASAVIATLWPVSDEGARNLAVQVYRALLAGEPLGEALRLARANAREAAPREAGWAAPVLYGDPTWRLGHPRASRHSGTVVVARWREADAAGLRDAAGVIATQGGRMIRADATGWTATFGVPRTLEDDAARSLEAALTLTAPALAIGVASGPIEVDPRGVDPVSGPLYLGPTLRRAAELAEAGRAGEIWVAPDTRRLVGGRFAFARAQGPDLPRGDPPDDPPGEALEAPGEDTGVWRLIGRRLRSDSSLGGASGSPSAAIGRARELAMLEAWLAAARAGGGSVVGVTGEAGVGKTHLVHALRVGDEAAAVRWIVLDPPAVGDAPLGTIARLLGALLDVEPGGDPAARRLAAIAQLAARAGAGRAPDPELETVVIEILGLGGKGSTRALPAEVPGRLTHLLRGLLAEASRRETVVLVADDAQRLDEASLEILRSVTEGIGRLPAQLILLYRPDWAHPWFNKPDYRHLALGPLDGSAESALAAARLGIAVADLPAGLDKLVARAGGNPFFVEETLRWLEDTAALQRRAGAWALVRAPAEAGLPGTVQRMLAARLDRLPPATRRVLDAAAVLGAAFDPVLLARVLGGAAIDAPLAELERRGFVVAPWGSGDYSFGHGLVREAALAGLLAQERRALHLRAGRVLESIGDPGDPGTLEQLAQHAFAGVTLGGDSFRPLEMDPGAVPGALTDGAPLAPEAEQADVDRAIRHLIAAGAQANRRYAARRSAGHFQAALALLHQLADPARDDLAVAQEGLGDALNTLGAFDAAISAYETALAALLTPEAPHPEAIAREASTAETTLPVAPTPASSAPRPDLPAAESRRRRADLARRIGRLHGWAARHEEALGWLARGLALLGDRLDAADRPVAALIHIHTGPIHYMRGQYDLALGCVQRGLGIVEGTDHLEVLATGFNFLGAVQDALGERDQAVVAYEHSLALWSAAGDSVQAARVEDNLGVTCFHRGDWDRAAELHRQALETFERIEDRDQIIYACVNLGNVHLGRGAFDDAEALFARAGALAESVGNPRLQAMASLNLGLVALERGDPVAARAALGASHDLQELHAIDELQAETFVALGRLALAEALADNAQADAAQVDTAQVEEAQDWAGRALTSAQAQQTQLEEALAHRLLGAAHRARGDLAQSAGHLRWSLAALDAAGHRFEAARTRVEWARTLWAAGQAVEAVDSLVQAIGAFEALGAAADLAGACAARREWAEAEVA